MKKRILVCLTMVFLLAVCLIGTATAASNVPEVSVVLSTNRFSGPQEVSITIRVTNTADTDMPGKVSLYDPAGKPITEFGEPVLAAGASKSWTGTWFVTEEQLAAGRIAFALSYDILDNSGAVITKTQPFYCAIVNTAAEADIEVRRTITPTTARNGQKVSVIYEISNVGGVDVTDVVIKESSAVSSSEGKIALIKAGEKATYTFTVTMGKKNLISNATVTAVGAGKTVTRTVDDATIKYGDVKLTATLKTDKKGGNIGDTLKLTLTLKNTGKVDYENVTVTDAILGTVFSGVTVKKGETVTLEAERAITQTCDYQFTVSGLDASGNTVETATERVNVIAVDPEKEVSLTVTATPDQDEVYVLPSVVKFTVYVTNNSAVEAQNVNVVSSGLQVYSFDTIAPGQTRSFDCDVMVSYAGQFRFDATVPNQLGERVTHEGAVVPVLKANVTPAPTQPPLPTPPATPDFATYPPAPAQDVESHMTQQDKTMQTIGYIAGGLTALCIVLIAVGIVGRMQHAAKSSKAADHLERDGYSDYTKAAPAKKRRIIDSDVQDTEPADAKYMADEPTDIPDPVMTEAPANLENAMNELYPDAAPNAPEADQQADETYGRRRPTQE